jgi:uncharacterized membrane protein YvlD (DUF360 family)
MALELKSCYYNRAMIRKFILRWLVNFLGLWAAAELMTGSIDYNDKLRVLIIAALIFSLVNAFMLFLVTKIYPSFHLRNFWTAIIATIIIWVVNYLLTELLEPKHEKSV